MATVKPDIWQGTSLTAGVQSTFRDSAVRRFRVEGLETFIDSENVEHDVPISQRRGAAIRQVLLSIGAFHPEIIDLPVADVSARMYSPTKAMVIVRYQRQRWSLPNAPVHEVVQYRLGYEYIEVYRTTADPVDEDAVRRNDTSGLPSGVWHDDRIETFNSQGGEIGTLQPRPWLWRRNIIRAFIPATTRRHPMAINRNLAQLTGTCNRNNVTFLPLNGSIWAPAQVRFDGASIDWTVQRGLTGGSNVFFNSSRFQVQYAFTIIPDGAFFKQHAFFNDGNTFTTLPLITSASSAVDLQWHTYDVPECEPSPASWGLNTFPIG